MRSSLSDYDMLLTEHLVQGVDVWINTPRRPWEACGTSGMKVLVNGGHELIGTRRLVGGGLHERSRLGIGRWPGARRRSCVGCRRSRARSMTCLSAR